MVRQREMLSSFLTRLEEQMDWSFDPAEFDDRLKLQKYVYLAQPYGYDHDYEYNMYVHGPYSPELTQDYYEENLRSWGEDLDPPDIDYEAFIAEVGVKSVNWLEAAATIISVHEDHREFYAGDELKERVIAHVTRIKDNISTEFISQVYADLEGIDIVNG